jgi:hypothetical protein
VREEWQMIQSQLNKKIKKIREGRGKEGNVRSNEKGKKKRKKINKGGGGGQNLFPPSPP